LTGAAAQDPSALKRAGSTDLDTAVIIVTFEASPFAPAYVEETGLLWPYI